MGRFVHLVCVTQNNNNKFYDMVEQRDTLQATYGRIGSSKQVKAYPILISQRMYSVSTLHQFSFCVHNMISSPLASAPLAL